jgi:membrane-bound serine protease (ClpP class)
MSGFGISAVLGIIAVFGGMILLSSSVTAGVISVLVTVVVMTLILVVSFKFMKKKNLIQRFILKDRTDTESGYTSPNMDNEIYMDREGYTLTPLRPAGSIKVGDERIDVVSEGDFVDAGVKVRVVGIDGTRIIVRTIE